MKDTPRDFGQSGHTEVAYSEIRRGGWVVFLLEINLKVGGSLKDLVEKITENVPM